MYIYIIRRKKYEKRFVNPSLVWLLQRVGCHRWPAREVLPPTRIILHQKISIVFPKLPSSHQTLSRASPNLITIRLFSFYILALGAFNDEAPPSIPYRYSPMYMYKYISTKLKSYRSGWGRGVSIGEWSTSHLGYFSIFDREHASPPTTEREMSF